jgi:hypothetical protein
MLFLWTFILAEDMLFISVKHHIHIQRLVFGLLMAPQGEMPLEELMTSAAGARRHFQVELRVRVGERARTRIIHGADVKDSEGVSLSSLLAEYNSDYPSSISEFR